ncbi:hypothetical protein ISG33_08370 [Glaciecola sp. MH2013]|uniref:hypothetical protein n=1 Tax=Glaciecola sp. MH2013 TaxID=2785524 RepID=UPI00189E5AEF|nr:hypothetical protein [Glaciecola sp. MH2013]MBF7073408.1 hypothetical protein [Glaciecola sp. MH2013]
MTVQSVEIVNEMNTPIWVVIAENQSHVIGTKTHTIAETEFEQYYRFMISGNVKSPIPEIPIDVGYKAESEYKSKLRAYYESHQEVSYEWSGFIVAGELEIAANSRNTFARKGDEGIYYISIRTNKVSAIADAVPRSEASITVDESGHISDPEPAPPVREKITPGVKVWLKHAKTVVGDPQTHLNWPCATIGNTGGAGHKIWAWSGKKLSNNMLVRIETCDRTVATKGYHFMYSSDIGNVYYDKKRDNRKQQWKILKTNAKNNSKGDDLCFGDTVKIASGKWSKANLGINGKWLQCVNDDKTLWLLSKTP